MRPFLGQIVAVIPHPDHFGLPMVMELRRVVCALLEQCYSGDE